VWRGSPAAHSAFLPQRFLPQPSFGRIYHKTLVCCRFARISTRIELQDSGHLYRWTPDGGCDSQTFSRGISSTCALPHSTALVQLSGLGRQPFSETPKSCSVLPETINGFQLRAQGHRRPRTLLRGPPKHDRTLSEHMISGLGTWNPHMRKRTAMQPIRSGICRTLLQVDSSDQQCINSYPAHAMLLR
jgi:hypothetical protein